MNPYISVIVPVYKTEEYLNQCVMSILNQTYENFELILIDDGSPDFSPKMCDEYKIMDSRVKVIHKCNGGLQSAIKAGIISSVGKFLCFIDSDDWVESNLLSVLVDNLNSSESDLIVFGYVTEYNNNKSVFSKSIKGGVYDLNQIKLGIYSTLLYNKGISNVSLNSSRCNKLIRRSIVIDNLRYYYEGISSGEDSLIVFPCILSSSKICILDSHFLYHYRMREGSITHSFDETLFSQYEKRIEIIKTILNDKCIEGFDYQIEQLYAYFGYFTLQYIRCRVFLDKKSILIGYISEIVKSKAFNLSLNVETNSKIEKYYFILLRYRRIQIIYYSLYFQELISSFRIRYK